MANKNKTYIFRRQGNSAGFTLIELLVSVAIGWIVISGLIYFIVQMLRTDRQEYALSETQREMSMAMDYIASELREAVYVYEGECLNTTGRPDDQNTTNVNEFCPGLAKYIKFPDSVKPVLAFWKPEKVPYSNEAKDKFPAGNACTQDSSCKELQLSRHTYTLVVYALRNDSPSGETWQGPARITRYQLRKYDSLSALTLTTNNWSEPYPDFGSWPCTSSTDCKAQPDYDEGTDKTATVLVDLVDLSGDIPFAPYPKDPNDPTDEPTKKNYSESKPDITVNGQQNTSFYAYIRRPTTGQSQDIIVYLRGNAVKRAGVSAFNSPGFFPSLRAQVQTRSTFNRTPSL